MKRKYLLLLFALTGALVSCKKCYNCEIYSYCAYCIVTDDTDGTVIASNGDVCGTEEEIDDYESSMKSTWGMFDDVTVECDRSKELDGFKEVCAKKSHAEDRVLILELAGYTCIED